MTKTSTTFLKSISLLGFIVIAFPWGTISTASAQSVTFKVNLQPQLKDSIYVPGRDHIFLQGNVFPLSNTKKVYLKDVAPKDSVFEATVDFPRTKSGSKLEYNFYISSPEKTMKESMPRHIQIPKGKWELDALYFNSFAW